MNNESELPTTESEISELEHLGALENAQNNKNGGTNEKIYYKFNYIFLYKILDFKTIFFTIFKSDSSSTVIQRCSNAKRFDIVSVKFMNDFELFE